MQGTILIVDAIATNRIVLKVKLKKAFYDVAQAGSLSEAIEIAQDCLPDLIIAAQDLPGGGVAELTRQLSNAPQTAHIPILSATCHDDPEARLDALASGVRDVLTHPVDETLLLGRVRSLIRAHNADTEWQMRGDTCRVLGLSEPPAIFDGQGRCLLACRDRSVLRVQGALLQAALRCELDQSPTSAVMEQITAEKAPDVIVLILPAEPSAAAEELRLISTLRASPRARHIRIIVVQVAENPALGANALDLGADDLMTGVTGIRELSLRVAAAMRRKRASDQLRSTVETGLKAAVFDPLTGLYNRRYAMPHLERTVRHAQATGRTCAVMAADLDHFKQINDAYGHASGDAVLVEVAHRLRAALRSTDTVARIGGEEFLVIMPSTTPEGARDTALRICRDVSTTPFHVPGSRTPIDVTISVGMAVGGPDGPDSPSGKTLGDTLLQEADKALYAAKGRGRNQVKMGRPAA